MTDLDAGTPARLPSIAVRPPLKEIRPHRLEQTQRSPALRLPSLQHLIDRNLVAYLGYNVDSDGRDGREIGMVTDGNVTQSVSSLDQAVSHSNFMDRAPGTLSSQHRDYARGPVGSSRTVLGRDTRPGDVPLQISDANVQTPQNTLFDISSQPSPRRSAIISEQVERDGRLNRLTSDIDIQPPLPLADLGYTKVVRTGDLVSNGGLYGFSAQTDTHIADALSLEANFNRKSTPICQRPYGSLIFMHVLNGDIYGVYNILMRCEGSLWDYDPYGLGLLYVSQQSQSRIIY